MSELIEHGQVIRGWLGIETKPLTEELSRSFGVAQATGILVSGIYRNSPAANGGLLPGDILTHINEIRLLDSRKAMNQAAKLEPGTQVSIKLLRNGQPTELSLTIGQRPISSN